MSPAEQVSRDGSFYWLLDTRLTLRHSSVFSRRSYGDTAIVHAAVGLCHPLMDQEPALGRCQ